MFYLSMSYSTLVRGNPRPIHMSSERLDITRSSPEVRCRGRTTLWITESYGSLEYSCELARTILVKFMAQSRPRPPARKTMSVVISAGDVKAAFIFGIGNTTSSSKHIVALNPKTAICRDRRSIYPVSGFYLRMSEIESNVIPRRGQFHHPVLTQCHGGM